MAGEWLKLELSTPDKPEILKLARILEIDKDAVLGKLVRLWAWFDRNSVDGVVDGIVEADIDALVTQVSFASALKQVNWIDFDNEKQWVSLSNFDRHNGDTAKQRALKNKRQAKWRDGKVDAHPSTKTSTREEKRREENYIPTIPENLLKDFLKVRKAKHVGELTETAFKGIEKEAEKAGITTIEAVEICCKRGWASFNASWDHGVATKKPKVLAL